MIEIDNKNVELTLQLGKSRSFGEDLQIANLETDQMSAQLKVIQALSQNCDSGQMNIETNKIKSAFMELADQLKVSKEYLTKSFANEKRLDWSLNELRKSFKLLQVEKSKILRELSESNMQIHELKQELNILQSSFQDKLQVAHRHINELQSLQTSNSFKYNTNEIINGVPHSCFALQNDEIPKKANIQRSSSTPCIRYQISSDDFSQICHNKVSDDFGPSKLLYFVGKNIMIHNIPSINRT